MESPLNMRSLQMRAAGRLLPRASAALLICLLTACGTDGEAPQDAGSSATDAAADDGGSTAADVQTDAATDDAEAEVGATDATSGDASNDSGAADAGPMDVGSKPDIDESKGLASPELLVKILGPSGRDWNQSESQKVQLSGILFGQAESLEWASSSGKKGTIDVDAYWMSGVIDLDEGDNTITVIAKAGGKTLTDEIHIVYNPFFSFEAAPSVSPNLLFVNESGKLIVRMPLAAAGSGAGGKGPVDPTSVVIVQVDKNGKQLKSHGALVDTGKSSHCDDIQKDSIFSTCFSITPTTAKRLYFRVLASVSVFNKKYTAKSPVAVVDVVQHFNASECNAIVGLQKKVKADYLAAVASGTATSQAQSDAIAAFKANATVADAGPASNGYGVWVAYKTGRVGALDLAPPGSRGASAGVSGASAAALPTYSVGTRRALTLAPNKDEFNKALKDSDEADKAGTDLKTLQCPPFAVDTYANGSARLQSYRDMSQYGVVAITGHGDAYFGELDAAKKTALRWEHKGSQEVLWSGERVQCGALLQGKKTCNKNGLGCAATQKCVKTSASSGVCVDHTQGDIMTGRVVIGAETYGLTPTFIKRHNTTNFPGSIVYLGACRSLWNGSLAVQLYGLGAAAVVGYSDYVTNAFASKLGHIFFDRLVKNAGSVLQGQGRQIVGHAA
ncbi:MAG: hypothetical protein KC502_20165, partial [Myxococcales bacterium]|nr:hypothetical protein [Myxococcales bacterium]